MKNTRIKKILMSSLAIFALLPSLVEAREVSIEQRVTGLYVAYFDRAGDQDGVNFWKGEASASSGDVLSVLNRISAMFATNEVFTSTYSHLSNRAFVQAIYQNALGRSGDSEGIDHWTGRLNSGMTRSDMVAEFIDISLTIDLTRANFPTLSTAELSAGQARQDLIANQVAVAARFTEVMGSRSNLSTHGDPTLDPAYQASVCILDTISTSSSTVSSAMSFLGTATIATINARCGEEPENIAPVANAGADMSALINTEVTLTGSGTDSDGTIASYEWKHGLTVLGTTATITYTTPAFARVDMIKLTVTDDDGATHTDSVLVTATEPEHTIFGEDCISHSLADLTVRPSGGSWQLISGTSLINTIDDADDAYRTLEVMKYYGMTKNCYVKRPNPEVKYSLVGNDAPDGAMVSEDCSGFNPNEIEVSPDGAGWKIYSVNAGIMYHFDDEDEAHTALHYIKEHGFTQQCFSNRPNPVFSYLRKGSNVPVEGYVTTEVGSSVTWDIDTNTLAADADTRDFWYNNGGAGFVTRNGTQAIVVKDVAFASIDESFIRNATLSGNALSNSGANPDILSGSIVIFKTSNDTYGKFYVERVDASDHNKLYLKWRTY